MPELRYSTYRYGVTAELQHGDIFRASQGPYYYTRAGRKQYLATHGVFKFMFHVVNGASEWLEAQHCGRTIVIALKSAKPPAIDKFIWAAYKIEKVQFDEAADLKKRAAAIKGRRVNG